MRGNGNSFWCDLPIRLTVCVRAGEGKGSNAALGTWEPGTLSRACVQSSASSLELVRLGFGLASLDRQEKEEKEKQETEIRIDWCMLYTSKEYMCKPKQ